MQLSYMMTANGALMWEVGLITLQFYEKHVHAATVCCEAWRLKDSLPLVSYGYESAGTCLVVRGGGVLGKVKTALTSHPTSVVTVRLRWAEMDGYVACVRKNIILNKRSNVRITQQITYSYIEQDRQCTYNVTIRRVRESLLPWKSSKYYLLVCVCMGARKCVHVDSRARGHVHAHSWT
jgi:hypothetical protein